MITDSARLVSAREAFPLLDAVGEFPGPPLGSSAGLSFDAAVEKGLLAHFREFALTCIRDGFPGDASVELDKAELDESLFDADGDRYRRILQTIGRPVVVHDISGPTGVPTYLCRIGTAGVGCASGRTSAAALTGALEGAVRFWQARTHGENRYAPPVLTVPSQLLSEAPQGRLDIHRSVRLPEMPSVLRRLGRHPIVVPLDHDPETVKIMPYALQVVVARD